MTALCGLAANFWQMLLARVGVGVGEAGTNPPSISMISDLYDDQDRARAMAVFTTGASVAIAIGFVVAGYFAENFGWRSVFFVAGIPGLIVAAVIYFTVPEPARARMASPAQGKAPSLIASIGIIWAQPSYRYIVFASALCLFITNGVLAWLPSFFIVTHGMQEGEIGALFGPILGICSSAGILVAGWLADRLGAADMRWKMWVVAIAMLMSIPFYATMLLAGSELAALAAFMVPAFLLAFFQPPLIAVTQSLCPVDMRSTSAALTLFIGNLIGLGLGPVAIGFATDLMTPALGDDALGRALLLAVGLVPFISALLWFGSRSLRNDLGRVDTLAGTAQEA